MDREAWHAAVYGVTKSRTPLSNLTLLLSFFPYHKVGAAWGPSSEPRDVPCVCGVHAQDSKAVAASWQ